MTLIPEANVQTSEPPKLRRTFTLPRNPFNSVRMSKRKPKTGSKEGEADVMTTNEADINNRKVFRRPSFKRFINKIAQTIGGVPGINQNNMENNRVPLVGLQTWGPEDTPGVTGLKNHGNTCFINAVLQCISHTDVLAEYFVLDKYKVDLSRRNKLNSKKFGTKGEVTEQLALLLKALWACQYSPELSTAFKQVVERHGSQYKGTQQHDALEFLQWLLDKVHEDLNTASKKKFKSIKTSGRPDEVIAAETLENYKRCNNSFIQGVFQAQYRSSLSCSRCRTQSNTFDPFQCISVQLPQFHKHSIYVTVLYTSQQPRQVRIGLSLPSGATVFELRDVLQSDTSIDRDNMLITEIDDADFMRTFNDAQSIGIITEVDTIYCIEVAQLKDAREEDSTSAYVLLCWINVSVDGDDCQRFGSPYTMQVSRETSYDDLQKLILKEMAPILYDDILTSSQPPGIFKMRISDPAWNDNEPPCYLEPDLEHPLFMEAVDQALALCSEEGGPAHLKLVLEWSPDEKQKIVSDDKDFIEEHSSVKMLKNQALQGGAPLTLEECLRDYTEAETLTDAWRCPRCQQYQPVVKTLDVWSLPDILIVHFKRFRQHSLRGGNSTKLTTMVDFPVYGFDMTPHLASKRNTLQRNVANKNEPLDPDLMNNGWSPWKRARKQSNVCDNAYDLYAVCYHHGTDLETGHYTAACKNPYDNQWYLYDDAKVVNLSAQSNDIGPTLVNNSAYILFYQKRNGIYVGSSSSSAASTSSVGSSQEHWVSRMPKFVLPRSLSKSAVKEDIFEDRRDGGDAKNGVQSRENVGNIEGRLAENGENINERFESKSNVGEVKIDQSELKIEQNDTKFDRTSLKNVYDSKTELNSFKNNSNIFINGLNSCKNDRVGYESRINGNLRKSHSSVFKNDSNAFKNDRDYLKNDRDYLKNDYDSQTDKNLFKNNREVYDKDKLYADSNVALRNSQNALHSSSNSVKRSTNSLSSQVRNSPTFSQLSNNRASETKRNIYTTSIYINSNGDEAEAKLSKSPVLSLLRVNGVEEDVRLRAEGLERRNEVVYKTTATVHRHSDLDYPVKTIDTMSRTRLNFMSPQPMRKLQAAAQSM